MRKPALKCSRCGCGRNFPFDWVTFYYCQAPLCPTLELPLCHNCLKDLGAKKGLLQGQYSKCPVCGVGKLRIIPLIGN